MNQLSFLGGGKIRLGTPAQGGVGQDHVRRHFAELALRNPYDSSFIGFILCLSSEEEYLGFDDFCYYSNNSATV